MHHQILINYPGKDTIFPRIAFSFFPFLVLVTSRKAQKTCSLHLSPRGYAHSQGGGAGEGACLLVVLRAEVGAGVRAKSLETGE